MVDPVVSFLGVESGDPIGHKRFLALFAGGMLPIISLSFLHMLVKFEEEEKNKIKQITSDIDVEKLSTEAGKIEKEFVEEKLNPTPEQLQKLEEELQKLNELKFGNLQEDEDVQNNRKVLSYLRRDA
jgi:hypothetical protein